MAAEQQQQMPHQSYHPQHNQFNAQFSLRSQSPLCDTSNQATQPSRNGLLLQSFPTPNQGWSDPPMYEMSSPNPYSASDYDRPMCAVSQPMDTLPSHANRPMQMFTNFAGVSLQQQNNVRQVAASHQVHAQMMNNACSPHPSSSTVSMSNAHADINHANGLCLNMNPSLVASNECLTSGSYGSAQLSGNNTFLMANNLSSRFGGSHGVGLEMLGTVSPHSSSPTGIMDGPAHTPSPSYVHHERPRSCDLPSGLNGSMTVGSLPNSALNSQLSSPLSMQPSPLHSPPSYGSGMQSPQPSSLLSSSHPVNSNNSDASFNYHVPVTSPQQSSPPAYPGSAPPSVASTAPSRPDSTTLSSAGSPPQLIPQSPQSQVPVANQTSPLSPAQHEPFPLDLDGLEECFAELKESNTNLFRSPTSPQSPTSNIPLVNMNNAEIVR
jgi:hypothetical protein